MKRVIIYMFFTLMPFLLFGQTPAEDFNWQLVWGDEFTTGPINKNAIKKEILLGGNGCNVQINPTNRTILLRATDKIVLNPGVTITPQQGNLVELSIVSCP